MMCEPTQVIYSIGVFCGLHVATVNISDVIWCAMPVTASLSLLILL